MLNLEASVTEQKKYLEEVKAWLQFALACRRLMSNEHVLCCLLMLEGSLEVVQCSRAPEKSGRPASTWILH